MRKISSSNGMYNLGPQLKMTQQYHLAWLFFLMLTSLLGHLAVRSVLSCQSQQLFSSWYWSYSRFELCCPPSAHYMTLLGGGGGMCMFLSKMSYLPNAGPRKVFVTVTAAFMRFIFLSCLRHFCCMVFSFFLRIVTWPSRCLIRFCWAQSLSTSQSLFISSAV